MTELQNKIERLLQQKAINIKTNETERIKHRGLKILPFSKRRQPRIGDFCRSIVIGKDETKKELVLHLTYLIDEDDSLYINHLKCKGYIKDYDLKEEYSIFTYLGNFKLTTVGTEILAQVRNIVVRENQKFFEMTLKYKKTPQNTHFNPGVTRDLVDISERDWKIYSKYGCFSGTFLAQYEENFANPGLYHRYCKDLKLKENDSLNQDSLIQYLQKLSLDYERVRQLQEKQWTDSHFMEGLKCLKANRPDMALQHLTLAKSFDKKSSKIYIARGCALANLNNLSEGLKQIREALRLSPDNKEALEYLEKIKKEMKAKESKEPEPDSDIADQGTRKIRLSNNMEPLRKR